MFLAGKTTKDPEKEPKRKFKDPNRLGAAIKGEENIMSLVKYERKRCYEAILYRFNTFRVLFLLCLQKFRSMSDD